MSSSKGSHVRTLIPSSTYTFKWSVEKFSKLLPGKTVRSPDFHPLPGSRWYSTLERNSSGIKWAMCNPDGKEIHVHHEVSIVDSSDKVWMKKALQKVYDRGNTECSLISISDEISLTELSSLKNAVVTFLCAMTLTGNEITSDIFEVEPQTAGPVSTLEKLSSDLKTMYGISLYTDVRLRIGDTILRAHKAILCARSPVFAKMFEHKLDEEETNTISIDDLSIDVLKDLLSYLYTGVLLDESFDSVFALYYAADKYDVVCLRKMCGDVLLSKLTKGNACRVMALADRHSDDVLKEAVMSFVDIYSEPILVTEGWTDLVNGETKLAAQVMSNLARKRKMQEEAEISPSKQSSEVEKEMLSSSKIYCDARPQLSSAFTFTAVSSHPVTCFGRK